MSTKIAFNQIDTHAVYVSDHGTDAAAVQAAFDTGASVIEFDGDQTYTWTEAIEVPSGTVINFNGCSITQAGNHYTFSVVGTSGARLSDITMNGPCTATASYTGSPGSQQFLHTEFADRVHLYNGISMNGYYGAGVKFAKGSSDCSVNNCSADSIGVISFYAEGQGDNGQNAVASGIHFRNCTATNFVYGFELKQVQGFSITDCFATDAAAGSTKYGILVTRDYNQGGYTDQYTPRDGIISNCVVTNPSPTDFGINVTASTDIIIDSCSVVGSGAFGITASGSHLTVSNCLVNGGTGTGISCGYGDPTLGTNGADASYDKAYMTVCNNTVKTHGGLSYNFTDCNSSTISDNKAIDQTGGTYVFAFDGCGESDIKGNGSRGGAQSSTVFRIEDNSNDNLLWVDNTSDTSDGTLPLSVPSTFGGYYLQRGDGYSYKKVSFLRTTDATPTTIDSLTLDTNKAWSVKQHTIVRNGSSNMRDIETRAFVARAGSTAYLTGTETTIHDHNAGTTAVGISVSGNDALVQVTGVAAATYDWTTITEWTRAK